MAPRRQRAAGASSDAPHAADSYRMFIRDLVVESRIGVYPHEREMLQPVRVNVDLEVRGRPAPRRDDIKGVLSYEQIIVGIKATLGGEHIQLVETVAERIAEICLADSRVLMARVAVEKLRVEPLAGGVGVEIERRRAAAG